jgi:hypothetical protein
MQEVKCECEATEREREDGLQVFRSAPPRQIDRHRGTVIRYLKSPPALPYRRQIGCQPHNHGGGERPRRCSSPSFAIARRSTSPEVAVSSGEAVWPARTTTSA